MLAPSDYRSQEIGIHRSDVAASTIRALGTTSTELAPAGVSPRLGGIETDLVDLVANRYNELTADETLPSNVSFWPRVTSIVISDKAFAALSRAQQRALEAAGRSALGPSMERLARDEHKALAVICQDADQRGSLAFLSATPSHLAALRTAVDPVYRRLEQSAGTRARHRLGRGDEAARHRHARPRLLCGPAAPPPPDQARRSAAPVQRPDRDEPLDLGGHRDVEAAGAGPADAQGQVRVRVQQGASRGAPPGSRRGSPPARCADACNMTITLGPHGEYRWVGSPGAVKTASRTLRRYAGLSLTFAGLTRAGDHRRLRASLVSDSPTGFPC